MSESFDINAETQIYTELTTFIDNLIARYPPEEKKWRGIMGITLLRSFLETGLKSDMDDPHEIMKVYDIMSDHIYEIYRNQDSLSWEPDESLLADSSSLTTND